MELDDGKTDEGSKNAETPDEVDGLPKLNTDNIASGLDTDTGKEGVTPDESQDMMRSAEIGINGKASVQEIDNVVIDNSVDESAEMLVDDDDANQSKSDDNSVLQIVESNVKVNEDDEETDYAEDMEEPNESMECVQDDSFETTGDISVKTSDNGSGIVMSIHGLQRKKSRKRKRKRSLFRTRPTPSKMKRLSTDTPVVPMKTLSADTAAIPTVVNKSEEDVIEAGTSTADLDHGDMGDHAYASADDTLDGVGTPESNLGTPNSERSRRKSRTPQSHNEYFLNDDEIIFEDDVKKVRTDRQKTPKQFVKNISPEEFAKYSAPFKHGWRREIVFRGTYDEVNQDGSRKTRPCDIYYHPPKGSKIRSMVQVSHWLESHDTNLTAENFTFMRRAIGIEEGEVVRHASRVSRAKQSATSPIATKSVSHIRRPIYKKKNVMKFVVFQPNDIGNVHDDNDGQYDKPEIVIERDSDDFSHIIASGIAADEARTLRLGNGREGTMVDVENIDEKSAKLEMIHPSNEAVIISPGKKKLAKSTARKSTTQKAFKKSASEVGEENLCSLTCPGMEGMTPLLHCNVCMCLFHNQCVNYYGPDEDFSCLRCTGATVITPRTVKSNKTVMKVSTPVLLSHINGTAASVGGNPTLKMVQISSPGGASTVNTSLRRVLSPVVIASPGSVLPKFAKIMTSSESVRMWQDSPHFTSPVLHVPSVPSASNSSMQAKSSASSYAEIQPTIKQEPIDDSYDGKCAGNQASTEALGNLKTVLNSRINSPELRSNQMILPKLSKVSTDSPASLIDFPGVSRIQPRIVSYNNPANTMQMIPVPSQSGGKSLRYVKVPVRSPVGMSSPNSMILPSMMLQQVRGSDGTVKHLIPATATVSVTGTSLLSTQAASKSDPQTTSTGPVVVNAQSVGAPMNGQLLTLPQAVVKRLTLNKALALKINNRHITVPPSGFFQSSEGLKVFLPPNTFPNESVENMSLSDVLKSPEESSYASSDQKSTSQDSASRVDVPLPETSKAKSGIQKCKLYTKCCLIQKLYGGCNAMEHIFKYLTLKELISVSQVCRAWRMVTMSPSLWSHVDFSGCIVSDWASAIQYMGTRLAQSLSLVDVCHYDNANKTWHQLLSSLQNLKSLQKISFGVVPSNVLQSMCTRLIRVESFCAEQIVESIDQSFWSSPTKLDVSKFSCMSQLKVLKLRGCGGLTLPSFSFSGGLSDLVILNKLQCLNLTSVKNGSATDFHFISQLTELKHLALGDCTKWNQETYSYLEKLCNLVSLRLEYGGSIPDPGLGLALSQLSTLEVLELHCFKIAYTFGNHISDLINLKHFYIMPDNTNFAAEVNSNTLAAVEKMTNLKKLTWVVPNSSTASVILDNNDNTQPQERWIPFQLNLEQSTDILPNSQYLNKSELVQKLKDILPNSEIGVVIEKEPKVRVSIMEQDD